METNDLSLAVIPLDDLKKFISKNNYIVPNNTNDIYNLVLDIIESNDYSYITDNIRDWIKAEWLMKYSDFINALPIYKSSDIILSEDFMINDTVNLIELSKQLNLTMPDKEQILRILTYLGKLYNDMSIFDSLPPDMIRKIIENLDCKSMILMCELSSKIAKICKQDNMLESILKDKFNKMGYDVEDFNLYMFQYMCLVLNRQYPTMTGYGDKLYILNNDYINIISFNNDLPDLLEIEVAFQVNNVLQIVYFGNDKLLLLNDDGTIDYLTLDNYEKFKIPYINNIIYILPDSNRAISANGSNFRFDLDGNKYDIIYDDIIEESYGICDLLKLKSNGIVYNGNRLISDINSIIDISSGNCHNLAVRSDGRVYSWGNNDYGQLGRDDIYHDKYLIQDLNNIIKVLAGDGISLALTNEGDVYRFGRSDNNNPQLIDEIINGIELYQNRNYVLTNLKSRDLDDLDMIYDLDKNNYNYQFVRTSDNIYYILIGDIITSFKL